ncbi:ankyrin repeat domain-containing protein 10-like [Takifugu flavidus]|uniref:Ankyrin repeat domain-containing protein 10 n=1 Tax=Takifugu flavidus TaxID=433684 RepID=A0A5C6NAR1_9TELE|nr:ankyrin repeat domain-containing protein 10-like [Takifugu flavidus]TWW64266.1 Ankyrin repeat domain-containing protein 10 [Takifugu flavidus]
MSVGLKQDPSSDGVFINRFPIHRACRDGDVGALVSILERLSNQTHLTVEDSFFGWTPLHWAAHNGQLECLMRLVQMGCEVNTATSHFKHTPTHSAAIGGHVDCLVWLTQAGADVNRQDLLGETPIHKAARSGSLECTQVLLIAGAKPSLQNTSGQTAADLAYARGFHNCFHLISTSQLRALPVNEVQNGDGASCGLDLRSRKRLLTPAESENSKRVRRAGDVFIQMEYTGVEEPENMSTEMGLELHPDDTKAPTNNHPPSMPYFELPTSSSPPSEAPVEPSVSNTCGSLHLSESPSSCASHRPVWWGITGADYEAFLHYGHYHGFGDTAEDLSDCSQLEVLHRYEQAVHL